MKTPSIIVVAVLALAAAAPVNAQVAPVVVQGDVPVARVSYADLNLGAAPGRQTLRRRVEHAASNLCLDNRPESLGELAAGRHCFSQAMARARTDIDAAVARAGAQLTSERMIEVAVR
jgi:UrcA family protein